jgi:hypothetical protein
MQGKESLNSVNYKINNVEQYLKVIERDMETLAD